jgi:release factor glutamine methyltransferase
LKKLYRDLVEQLSGALNLLPDKPEETPETTLCALWHAAAGVPVSVQNVSLAPTPLDAAQIARLQELVLQRIAGIPLAHLTGRQRFMSLELLAGREALIPRSETELLGWAALDALHGMAADKAEVVVVDVCTGCGNLALALAYHAAKARAYAADLSEDAVALARRNARHLRMENRVEFRVGDLLGPFDEPAFHRAVDLLVCNPPYISSRKVDGMPHEIIGHEPRLAFDGGPLGIRIIERLIRDAPRFLRAGGCLAFEVGLGQGPAFMKRLSADGRYARLRPIEDAAGAIRAVVAEAR